MSDALREIISRTQDSFRADPKSAQATFESVSVLGEGLCSSVSMRTHNLVVDEPESLGGTDNGPNPVELILAALGSCQEITYRAYAAAMGIPLNGVSVKLEGNIDLRGFFAVDESVRPGYSGLQGTVTLDSPADRETLEQLRDAVNAHCPVLDIIRNPVPVELALETAEIRREAAE